MEMEMIKMIENILERVVAQGVFHVLSQRCKLSVEAIRRVFQKLLEEKPEDELKAIADSNKDAAWAMYVQMITRNTTQPLPDEDGDEQTALDSIYSLFDTTRDILTEYGRESPEFSKLAVLILNQKVRPFTAKWHPKSIAGDFEYPIACAEFRQELKALQGILLGYMQALAALAGVEDFTDISEA